MLEQISETGSAHLIQLIYGVTNDVDLVGIERLKEFASKISGFTFVTCVAAADSAHLRKGYVMAHGESDHLNGGDVDVYLCGPPPMVDAVRSWLAQQGIAPANFYYEKFSPAGAVTAVGLRIEGFCVRPTATTRNVVSSIPAKRKPAPLP